MSHFEPISSPKTSLTQFLAVRSLFFTHIGAFIAAALVGVARYSQSVPANLTVFMALWSVGLLMHGYATRQEERRIDLPEEGIFKTAWWAVIVNALMWVMWSLATEATIAAPWHLTTWIALAAGGTVAVIAGKRRLYAHWAKEHLITPQKSKPKRRDTSLESLQLDDDGELPTENYLEDAPQRRADQR